MAIHHPNRRTVLTLTLAATAASALPGFAQTLPTIHVAKDPNCGCCTDWMKVLGETGFKVTYEHRPNEVLSKLKADVGIPENMTSCHTAIVDGYIIEGHVPPADIMRLLADKTNAIGLTVPGMPYGSPGMGPESERDAYKVYLILPDGSVKEYADYPAG